MVELSEALIAAGWLVGNDESFKRFDLLHNGEDLLPLLAETARTMPPSRRVDSLARLLAWLRACGAKLTLGWPPYPDRPLEDWLGSRLMWWPNGVPEGRKVAWVSSRLGRAIDERPDWFAVLRSAAAKIDSERDVLLTASGTTVDRFLERAAILFDLRRLRVQLDEQRTLVDWLIRLRRRLWRSRLARDVESSHAEQLELDTLSSEVFVSPVIRAATTSEVCEPQGASRGSADVQNRRLAPNGTRFRTDRVAERRKPPGVVEFASLQPDGLRRTATKLSAIGLAPCRSLKSVPSDVGDLPLSDRVLIAAADQVLALQVRPNGNLHQLLRARLSDIAWPPASVWLSLGEALVPTEVAAELQSLGAIGWWLFAEHVSNGLASSPSVNTLASHNTMTEMPWRDGDYLVHWTRRRDGPWPGQSEADFIDDLLLSREATSHSAFAALSRIVQQRRLIASAAGIRGDAVVVSFSACPLHELTQRRAFRTHRNRWDYEAYGLCVRREWLQTRGAKPVIYGDDDLWMTLADADRPYFQLKTTRSRGGAKTIDWSLEEEWRVPQDLDLSAAGRDDVLLFVPTVAEAQQLAAISPWPVHVACRL